MNPPRHRVAVVGAGHGGLALVAKLRGADVDVTLIDQHNHHTFQALLYQVATAALDAEDVAHQVRHIVRHQDHVSFRMGRVTGFDLDAREVLLEDGRPVPYDSLVVAAGTVYADLGVPGVREHAYVLKSLREAVALRSHVLRQFEKAAQDPRVEDGGRLTFVLVGAGATGVELAGALVELFVVTDKDYPELRHVRPRVVLLEAGDAVLPSYHPATRAYTERVLRRRGVDVRLGARVAAVTAEHVDLADGERIRAHTLVWTAGVRAHPLAEALGVELPRSFRVPVTDRLHLEERAEVFVIGDMSGLPAPDGAPYPMVAQVAIQQGKHVAKVLRARLEGAPDEPFVYQDRGSMAIIGRAAGIAELSPRLGGFRLQGFVGWLAWLFLHLIYLPGHQNRVSAFATWVYSFVTRDRHARLVLDRPFDGRRNTMPD